MIWLEGAIRAVAVLLAAMTVIPMFKLPHGAVRSFSFARQQVIVVASLALMAALALRLWWAAAVLGIVLVWQAAYIAAFFPHGRVQSLRPDPELRRRTDLHLRIMAANVKVSNRAYHRLVALVEEEAPHLLVLLETDADWLEGLSPLHSRFPHRAERPLDTGYGMALYADRPLEEVEWRELLVAGVPSLKVTLRIAGRPVRVYVLHPEPPVPLHDTKGRDAEIGLVGMEAARDPLPAIVTGDLNDVAWSHTTRRFQRLSGQLDPRVGRGFFNTFHAQVPIWRWPLDHLFHDPRFRLVEMRRLPDFGSDHFAMLFGLALAPDEAAGEMPEQARAEDRQAIRDMAAEEAARDRPAIGEDWERA